MLTGRERETVVTVAAVTVEMVLSSPPPSRGIPVFEFEIKIVVLAWKLKGFAGTVDQIDRYACPSGICLVKGGGDGDLSLGGDNRLGQLGVRERAGSMTVEAGAGSRALNRLIFGPSFAFEGVGIVRVRSLS